MASPLGGDTEHPRDELHLPYRVSTGSPFYLHR
jgi:hypothetical protein